VDYAAALIEQNHQLGELLRDADWSTPVPTCPGWTLLQLLRHVGRGDRWAAQIVADRMDSGLDPRAVRDGKPPADVSGAIQWFSDSPRTLLAAAEAVGENTEVWTFLGPKPVSWWVRRRLHEATVHRADVAVALDVRYELSAELAADGISEWLDRLVEEQALGRPPSLPAETSLALRATDPDLATNAWTVRGGARGVRWTDQPAGADVGLSGAATDLLLAMVRRRSVDEVGIRIEGDAALWRSWLELTPL
jgi:uncharacterized protein (TIGR03083 family)